MTTVQDDRDHAMLLKTLTSEVVPLFYDRDASGLPRGWIARQKSALATLAGRFNADRMVMDYVRNCYIPAAGLESCSVPELASTARRSRAVTRPHRDQPP